jgi:hypothetical protein
MDDTIVDPFRHGEPAGSGRCRGHGTGDPLSGYARRLP